MKDKHGNRTIKQRMARHEEAQEARGLVRVKVWVPADRRQDLLLIAEQFRKAAAQFSKAATAADKFGQALEKLEPAEGVSDA